jgi:hypothetical protein
MTRLRRRVRPAAALLVLAVVAAGCKSSVTTSFDVSASPTPSVTIEAAITFDTNAAAAFDSASQARLEVTIAQRTGRRPTVTRGSGAEALRLHVPLTYDQIGPLSGLTGVSDVRLELIDDELAVLHVELSDPVELAGAIRDAAAGQPDEAALAATLLAFTYVGVSVRFAGQVLEVRTPDVSVAPTLESDTVVVTQPLDRYITGPVTVAGTLTPANSRGRGWWPPLVAGSAVLTLAGAVWWVRRQP